MKNKIKNIIVFLIVLFTVTLIVGTLYYKKNFAQIDFATLLYNALGGVENANTGFIADAIKENIVTILLGVLLAYIPILKYKKKYKIDIKIKDKKKGFTVFPFNKKIYLIIIFLSSLCFFIMKVGVIDFIKEQSETSYLFDKYYTDTKNKSISFPENKRNLIVVFLESMETSLISQEEGGGWEYTVIPELADLAKENINFSDTEKIGGGYQTFGTGWTIAGMVSQTTGIPLKINITSNSYSGYSSFLPGAYSLGDILKKEGYNLEVMFGSNANFAGRKDFFTVHGDYTIFDVNTAIEQEKMTEEEKVWWGFDDDNLYSWAKEEILNLSQSDQPFNFIMLTADTHFKDGYLSKNAEEIYNEQYENVFAYSSKSINEFIKWIQQQDFYKNTTIVLIGDHLGMQSDFYEEHIKNNNYNRKVYNVFINSAINDTNSKNRKFSTLDIFPTILASIGAKIDGERLGLGTNLFSDKNTLIEELGYDVFNDELSKKSNYYNKYILKGDYLEMLKETSKE